MAKLRQSARPAVMHLMLAASLAAAGSISCVRGGFTVESVGTDGPLTGDGAQPRDLFADAAGDVSGDVFTGEVSADGPTGWPGCVAEIAVSTLSTCVLFRDGHVECTGHNSRGQLGDNTTNNRRVLAPAIGLSDVVRVDAAAWGYCAVRSDATVWCWGDPSSGRFGSIGPAYVKVPTRVPELSNVLELEGGSTSSCGVLTGGDVVCMGANDGAQLGDPAAAAGPTPVAVTLPQTVLTLAACWGGVAVLLADGSVMSWGNDGATHRATPGLVGIDDVVEISAHAPSFYARCNGGTILAWGRNSSGQLGDATTTGRKVPVPVSGITDAISVAGGGTHACAVLASGAVRCWGENGDRLKLGVEGLAQSNTPVTVTGLPPALVVKAGQEHSCAIVDDGSVWCWGHAASGQLGIGTAAQGQLATRMLITCP